MPDPDLVDIARLEPLRRQQVDIIAKGVRLRDADTLAAFGAGPQRKLSGLLEQLLTSARAEETVLPGALATALAANIEALDLPALRRELDGRATLLARLPVLGRYYSAQRRFQAAQATIVAQFATIEAEADAHRTKLADGRAGLDRLLDATEATLRELEAWIAGGQRALSRIGHEVEAERAALGDGSDGAALAKLQGMAGQRDAFAARLLRMHATFTLGRTVIPQVRIVQQAGRAEMQVTLEAILLDLPDLRAAAGLAPIGPAELRQLGRASDTLLAALETSRGVDRAYRVKREEAVQRLGEFRLRLLEGLLTPSDHVRQPQGTEFR